MKIIKKACGVITLGIAVIFGFTGYYAHSLPSSYFVNVGEDLEVSSNILITAEKDGYNGFVNNSVPSLDKEVTLKLFGVVPIKNVVVTESEAPLVVAGGNPFGIKILTEGVMVVTISDVKTSDGKVSPAKDANIKEGDVILSIDDVKTLTNEDVANAISKSNGSPVSVLVKREDKQFYTTLEPYLSESDNAYKAGMWVRDSSAGIGTITFFDPETKIFGGLGHPVCDSDTGSILPIHSGEVVPVKITGYQKGEPSNPGELNGAFVSGFSVGELLTNCKTGVFGHLASAPNDSSPIPIAYKQEVTREKATILTTLSGGEPAEYDIEIVKIDYLEKADKNMVIRVTDPELLEKTGGIVQGMSGSPIIQNGKLIGAVTHVFVNDPTQGYGIFIENMMTTAESVEN